MVGWIFRPRHTDNGEANHPPPSPCPVLLLMADHRERWDINGPPAAETESSRPGSQSALHPLELNVPSSSRAFRTFIICLLFYDITAISNCRVRLCGQNKTKATASPISVQYSRWRLSCVDLGVGAACTCNDT